MVPPHFGEQTWKFISNPIICPKTISGAQWLQVSHKRTPLLKYGIDSSTEILSEKPASFGPLLDMAAHSFWGLRGAALSFIKLQITKRHQLLRHLHLFSSVDPASLNFNGLLSADMPATHHPNQLLSHPRAGQLTSEVVSVDDHLSLGQLSATQLSESQYQMTSVLQCNTSSPLGGRSEEAIIELDERRTPPKIQQKSR